ncbi:MAG: magnesium transporter, partial [Solirubrobacteraceae bacterium]
RVWDMLENYKEVVEALESTNEAVLSHRLNDTFRILTAISVIVLPLTLIASIFGMNTHVPGEQSSTGFWVVVGIMIVVLVATIALFRRRGWL